MTELQYKILQTYNSRKEINSYEFYEKFIRSNPQYTRKEVEKEMSYLNASEFLEAAPGQYNTLRISKLGEQKFNLEHQAMQMRLRWSGTAPFESEIKNATVIKKVRPKWLTLEFWWEDTLKKAYGYLLVGLIALITIGLNRCNHDTISKENNQKSAKQQLHLMPMKIQKDTVP